MDREATATRCHRPTRACGWFSIRLKANGKTQTHSRGSKSACHSLLTSQKHLIKQSQCFATSLSLSKPPILGVPKPWTSNTRRFHLPYPQEGQARSQLFNFPKIVDWTLEMVELKSGIPVFRQELSSIIFGAIVSCTGISNKTLSLFSSKLASYVQILVQISSPYRQLKSAKKSFWDQLFTK